MPPKRNRRILTVIPGGHAPAPAAPAPGAAMRSVITGSYGSSKDHGVFRRKMPEKVIFTTAAAAAICATVASSKPLNEQGHGLLLQECPGGRGR